MQSFEIENVLIHIHSHIHHMGNCVKSFDCDNKAYNFLALLTQLKGVKRSNEWEWEGDHIEGVHGIFTYATSKGNKGREGKPQIQCKQSKDSHSHTGWQRNLLAVSFRRLPPKKENKRNTYTHTYMGSTMGCIMVYLYVVEYALRNAARWGLTAVQYCVAIDFRDFCQGVALLFPGLRIAQRGPAVQARL